MEEHPLFEQGDACPAIRLPLQQFEAMDKACRWPVAPRQSEPCLYGRLLFVQMACTCLQFRLAMLLHFFQPPPQDAKPAVLSMEAPWQARSTRALVHGQGFRHLLLLEKEKR